MVTDGRETTEVVSHFTDSILDETMNRIQLLLYELQEIDRRCNPKLPAGITTTQPRPQPAAIP